MFLRWVWQLCSNCFGDGFGFSFFSRNNINLHHLIAWTILQMDFNLILMLVLFIRIEYYLIAVFTLIIFFFNEAVLARFGIRGFVSLRHHSSFRHQSEMTKLIFHLWGRSYCTTYLVWVNYILRMLFWAIKMFKGNYCCSSK